MALRLRVTTQAKRDTGRILGYIAKDNPEAAAKLADALEHGMLRLLNYPLSAPVVLDAALKQINPDIRQLTHLTHVFTELPKANTLSDIEALLPWAVKGGVR